jgi:GNAT superfamily N-acetyltransferase
MLPPESRVLTLRDGTRIRVRALVPTDRALIADAFERLSPRSRFLRFFSPQPRLSRRMLDALMAVDHDGHVALIALHEATGVGVVRYVRDRENPARADLAITVVDAFQGRGLGRALMAEMIEVAAQRGIRELTLDIHPDNHVMTALVRSLGVSLAYRDGAMTGVLEVRAAPALKAA